MTSPASLTAAERTALVALVPWAIRTAMARAQAKGLPEDDVVSEALHAIDRALRTHTGATTLSDHIERRVLGALLDGARREKRRRKREVLFDDLEEARPWAIEDDEDTLARALGVEAEALGSPEQSLLRREQQAARDAAVDKLPPRDRRLYVLRHREELTWDEITAETGIPARTARLYDKKIRDHLTALLRALDAEG